MSTLNNDAVLVKFYVTFGVQYGFTEEDVQHPQGMSGNGYVTIEAQNEDEARHIAFQLFGRQWAFMYDRRPSLQNAPMGEVLKITQGVGIEAHVV